MNAVTFHKIRADQVLPGMCVARYRMGPFAVANAVESRRIMLDNGRLIHWRDAPLVWVREEVEDVPEPEAVKGLRSGAVAAVYPDDSRVFVDGECVGNVAPVGGGWRVLLYSHTYPELHTDEHAAKGAALALLS
jgi:hypothetical protein